MSEEYYTGVDQEVYNITLKIKNWVLVQHDKQLIEKQRVIIETNQSSWYVGLKMSTENNQEVIRIYWHLKSLKGDIKDIAVKASTTFLYGDNSEHSTYVKHDTLKPMYQIEVPKYMSFNGEAWATGKVGSWVNIDGCRNFKLELVVKLPYEKRTSEVVRNNLQNYLQISQKKFGANFAALLNDPSSADIKIMTSDNKQLFAHKLILNAQCPVFESMFRSKLTEDKTGIIHVDDICEKTMKIILHYFYTGQLLPSWCDSDVIVEFIYAAGKYQMTEVLDMINNGLLEEVEDFDCKMGCEMELLSMLHKLSLENAESWLMKRIITAANDVKSSAELLALFAGEK